MTELLSYEKIDGGWIVRYYNKVYMGDIVISDDGYYVWWPDHTREGYIESHVLRTLADKLDELNKAWDDEIHEYFDKQEGVKIE